MIDFDTPSDYIDVPLIYYNGYSADYQDQEGEFISLPVSDKGANKTVRVNTTGITTPGVISVDYTGTHTQKLSLLANILFVTGLFVLLFNRKIKEKFINLQSIDKNE